jgi:hypothetical protein
MYSILREKEKERERWLVDNMVTLSMIHANYTQARPFSAPPNSKLATTPLFSPLCPMEITDACTEPLVWKWFFRFGFSAFRFASHHPRYFLLELNVHTVSSYYF